MLLVHKLHEMQQPLKESIYASDFLKRRGRPRTNKNNSFLETEARKVIAFENAQECLSLSMESRSVVEQCLEIISETIKDVKAHKKAEAISEEDGEEFYEDVPDG